MIISIENQVNQNLFCGRANTNMSDLPSKKSNYQQNCDKYFEIPFPEHIRV